MALRRRPRIRRLFLPAFLVLAILGRDAAQRVEAQGDIYERIADFNAFALAGGTNNVGSNYGGGAALAVLIFELHNPFPPLKRPSVGGSLDQGTLFGTASLGGVAGEGTVFTVNTDGTGFSVLHNFTNLDGAFPAAGLVLSGDTLYGTTVNGGSSDNGAVFAVSTNGTGFRVLHNFTARRAPYYTNSDGGNPYAALILSGDTLYGTAQGGGSANAGTVFALNTNSLVFTVLHSFTAAAYDSNFNLTNSDGANPSARLVVSGDTLYGTASRGGNGGAGAVFAVSTNGTGFKVLHAFAGADPLTLTNSDGVSPSAGLILSGDVLYGTASQGGSANSGAVFAVNTNGTLFTNLYSFTGGGDGARPASELVLLTNTLIGTASGGGNTGGEGTVFSINTNGTGFTVIYSFQYL